MFSSAPSIASKSAAALDSLLFACTSVAEQCLYAIVDPADAAAFRDRLSEGETAGWLRAGVTFGGAIGGRLEFLLPAPAVRDWCAGFTGAEPDAPLTDAQVVDFAAELANMTCGAWLTQASGRRLFRLDAPRVDALDTAAVLAAADADADGVLYLLVNDVPVRLALTVDVWEGV